MSRLFLAGAIKLIAPVFSSVTVALLGSLVTDAEVEFFHSLHLIADPFQRTDRAVRRQAFENMRQRVVISLAFFAVAFMPA